MSQVNLTNAERVAALQRFGYSEREASFVSLAALHSGYFLRRQFGQFIGRQDGGNVTQLIEKALDFGHLQVATYRANTHIYHLAARPFYAALGQEDNRNRRPKEPSTIKAKLMGLDFVLSHPDHEYLATEQEKLDYFAGRLRLETSVLPTKRYANNGQMTERYFVEKYPLFLCPSAESALPPVVSFCFIDEGSVGLSGFTTFLSQYRGLLTSLRGSRVIFVAAKPTHFEAADKTFTRFANQDGRTKGLASADPSLTRMREHFEARRLYAAQNWHAFDRAKLIRFRNEREEFSGPEIDALFELWMNKGWGAVLQTLGTKQRVTLPIATTFSTCLLEYSYDLFGNLTAC